MLPEVINSIIDGKSGPLSHEDLVLGESIRTLEIAIYNELNDCLNEYHHSKSTKFSELAKITAELQCALDIVQSAKTNEERRRVYEILKNIGKLPE